MFLYGRYLKPLQPFDSKGYSELLKNSRAVSVWWLTIYWTCSPA